MQTVHVNGVEDGGHCKALVNVPTNWRSAGGTKKRPLARPSEGYQGALVIVAPLSPRRLLFARLP